MTRREGSGEGLQIWAQPSTPALAMAQHLWDRASLWYELDSYAQGTQRAQGPLLSSPVLVPCPEIGSYPNLWTLTHRNPMILVKWRSPNPAIQ